MDDLAGGVHAGVGTAGGHQIDRMVGDEGRCHRDFCLDGTQAGLLLPQSQLTAANLAEVLGGLNRTRCLEWAEQARTLALPHSAEDVADIAIATTM